MNYMHTSHVSLSVCLSMSNTLASFAKSAELIEMLFKGGGHARASISIRCGCTLAPLSKYD